MLANELLELCRSRGFVGSDPHAAAAWLLARLGPSSAGGAASTLPDLYTSVPLGDPAPSQDGVTEQTAGPSVLPAPAATDRYEDLGAVGSGGMGEVRRVRDTSLNRTMAMKTIRPELLGRPAAVARFVEEAQATAQLQHPGIVPVHELGSLPDGRLYFTMKEVRGRTLGEVITEVHACSKTRWEPAPSGWTFRRLVDAFHRVCEAVAYAHDRGVVHRDLKPDNVMLGDYGEVLVLDWGLAKVRGRPDLATEAGELDPQAPALQALEPVVTDRSQDQTHHTRMGAVAGTPAYMPPEQARGDVDAIDARSDVYALGAILYELLSGRPPYQGSSAGEVLQKVLTGPPQPPGRSAAASTTLAFGWDNVPDEASAAPGGPELPAELVAACLRAMAWDPAQRFPDAAALAPEIAAWLDGARKREQALEVIQRAAAKAPEADALRARAALLRKEAEALLAEVEPWQPEEDKAPGWALEDEAAALDKRAALAELEQESLLQASLTHAPDLPEAHAALAARYRAEHEAAEALRRDSSRSEALLRSHAAALPENHVERLSHQAYLQGDGALSLVTDPPGAEVLLHRYTLKNRRLVPVFERSLGRTPLAGVTLPMGSYLCILRHPDRADTRYPVVIGRGEHWDGVPPGAADPQPVWLPRVGDLAPADCYVPAGWFWAGGDPEAVDGLPRRRLWCDGRVFARMPVTNREYIAFLDDLAAQGREEEALRHAPRERGGTAGELGALIYGFETGRFGLRPDADGDVWLPDWPVVMVDWWGARAYAEWHAARTGRSWRLPGELEWAKAARGVDGRLFPWGDLFDPSWCCMRDSHAGRILPAEVDRFPVDESPYGVRGMAGNVRDWCADVHSPDGPPVDGLRVEVRAASAVDDANRVYRGGSWNLHPRFTRLANRLSYTPGNRNDGLGFRLARSIP